MEPQENCDFLQPKYFIKDRSNLSDYECTICYELPAKPVRCSFCRKSFCMSCVSDQKKIKDMCPFRCTPKFSIEAIPEIAIEFNCPYSSECLEPIKSIREFYDHDLICRSISPEDQKFKTYMRQYLCLKGKHTLQFFVGTYNQMCNSLECSHCKKKKLCRSICRPCNERFCIQCRPVPASKKQCPIGHQMLRNQLSNMSYICDICGLPSALSGRYTYDDHCCNFGICELCYGELPEERPPINCIQNNPEYCSQMVTEEDKKQHRLVILKEKQSNYCQLCHQKRKCSKKCQKCQKYYCLNCKIFLIEPNDTCVLEHDLKIINIEGKLQCDKCLSMFSRGYEDKECGVYLCNECFKYGKMMKSDSERFIKQYFCEKGHQLMFHTARQNLSYLCSKCEVYGEIKFFCVYCGNNKLFCCKCFPLPDPDLCYLGHPLKFKENELFVCHVCSGKGHPEAKQAYVCNKCNFCVCKKCHKKIKNAAIKVEE